jgi:hypothetical protein
VVVGVAVGKGVEVATVAGVLKGTAVPKPAATISMVGVMGASANSSVVVGGTAVFDSAASKSIERQLIAKKSRQIKHQAAKWFIAPFTVFVEA